jgi:uracil phosphoribosyltransferase
MVQHRLTELRHVSIDSGMFRQHMAAAMLCYETARALPLAKGNH